MTATSIFSPMNSQLSEEFFYEKLPYKINDKS